MNAQHILDMAMSFHAGAEAAINTGKWTDQITCKRGCSACCRLLAIPHGLEVAFLCDWILSAIARDVAAAPFWAIVDRTVAVTAKLLEPCDHSAYFALGLDCPLLGPEKDCLAYEYRPAPCRYHFVVSPREMCESTDDKILKINLKHIEAASLGHLDMLSKDRLLAPLPVRLVDMLYRFSPTILSGAHARRIRSSIWDAGIANAEELTRRWHDFLLGDNATLRLAQESDFVKQKLDSPDVRRFIREGKGLK